MTVADTRSAESLVAILVAARKAGDRDLERRAKQELRDSYGLKISFEKKGATQ